MSEPLILPQRPKKSKALRVLLVLAVFLGLGALACLSWYRYTYPYGYSHACSKGLCLSLKMYAGDHNEWLPYGEATPEASLSLLYRCDPTTLPYFGGKNISQKTVKAALERDGLLSPSTCGWNYIEGLRDDDDPHLAFAWDKTIGLWHNGNRKAGLMHEAVFLDGSIQFVTKGQWPYFLAEEKKRLEAVIKSRDANDPPIRWSDEESLGPNRPLRK